MGKSVLSTGKPCRRRRSMDFSDKNASGRSMLYGGCPLSLSVRRYMASGGEVEGVESQFSLNGKKFRQKIHPNRTKFFILPLN
jgi:hypothetical protein